MDPSHRLGQSIAILPALKEGPTALISFDCLLRVRPNSVVFHRSLGRPPACDWVDA